MSNRSGRRSSYSDQLTISGIVAVRHFSATTSPAVALGAAGHLWKLPVQKSAPSSAGASISAGAWAPSTISGTSWAPHSSASCRIGKTIAVAELIWSTISAAVRSSTAVASVATTVASSASSGTSTITTSAWFALAKRSAANRTAPYAWFVSTIRLPLGNRDRGQGRGDAGAGVGDQREAGRVGLEKRGQLEPAGGQTLGDRAEPQHRIGLCLGPQLRQELLGAARDSAVRAMVEVQDVGVEGPQVGAGAEYRHRPNGTYFWACIPTSTTRGRSRWPTAAARCTPTTSATRTRCTPSNRRSGSATSTSRRTCTRPATESSSPSTTTGWTG